MNDIACRYESNLISSITLKQVSNFLILLSIAMFSYRGNYAALLGIFAMLAKLLDNISLKKVPLMSILWVTFLSLFSVAFYLIRNFNWEFYVLITYVMCIFFLLFLDFNDLKFILKGLYIFSIIIVFGIFLQKILPDGYNLIAKIIFPTEIYNDILIRYSLGYITGFTHEVSYSCLFLILGLSYLFYFDKSRFKKIILILLYFIALFMTGKKAQPVFCILALGIVAFFANEYFFQKLKLSFAIIVLTVIVYFTYPLWSQISFLERITTFLDALNEGKSVIGLTSGRTVLYERAMNLWNTNKTFGIGWLNFRFMSSISGDDWYSYYDVHNCYMQLLCETGLFGLICYAFTYLYTLTTNIITLKHNNNCFTRFSLFYIVFFALYAITGTCLYTDCYVLVLFLCIQLIAYSKNKR